jgi:hypothetical protein
MGGKVISPKATRVLRVLFQGFKGAYGERLSTSDAFVAVAFCDKEPSKQLPVRFGSTGRIDPMRTGVNKAGLELPEPHWSRRRWYKPSGR